MDPGDAVLPFWVGVPLILPAGVCAAAKPASERGANGERNSKRSEKGQKWAKSMAPAPQR